MTIRTYNPTTDENDENEMMNGFIEEEKEETKTEVHNDDDDANIDGDADDMIGEEDYCTIFTLAFRKQKGKKDALSVYIKLFKKPIVFQHLMVTNNKTVFLEIN